MDEQLAALPQHRHPDVHGHPGVADLTVQNNRLSDKMDRQFENLAGSMDRIAEQHHKDVLMLMSAIVRLNDRVAKMER